MGEVELLMPVMVVVGRRVTRGLAPISTAVDGRDRALAALLTLAAPIISVLTPPPGSATKELVPGRRNPPAAPPKRAIAGVITPLADDPRGLPTAAAASPSDSFTEDCCGGSPGQLTSVRRGACCAGSVVGSVAVEILLALLPSPPTPSPEKALPPAIVFLVA